MHKCRCFECKEDCCWDSRKMAICICLLVWHALHSPEYIWHCVGASSEDGWVKLLWWQHVFSPMMQHRLQDVCQQHAAECLINIAHFIKDSVAFPPFLLSPSALFSSAWLIYLHLTSFGVLLRCH
ncbi:hypothetical protein GQ54DRAFT_57248 [Martensiomyces pterosporus]|nr:hypothetical protein GQ54DRAFT_57248 [Martensiomyces pterosporus]